MARVAAIALDAGEWTLIERLLDQGELPNLARIRARSMECRLENGMAYRAELPWTQFVTGRDAMANRYWSTVKFDPSNYDTYAVYGHDAKPFYAQPGTKVLLFDFPHTVFRDDVDGVHVTAWGGHSAHYPHGSRPEGLLREIDAKFGPHPAFDNDYGGSWYQPDFINALADAMIVGARRRTDIALWLQERYPDWDLFMTAMSESHSGGHHFWHGVDENHIHHHSPTAALAGQRLLDVYRAIDESVGRLADNLPADTNLVVFAVHGMQANDTDVTSTALLPEFLYRLQFGKSFLVDHGQATWRKHGYPVLQPDPRWGWTQMMRDRIPGPDGDRLARVRQQIRLSTPDSVRYAKRSVKARLKHQGPIPPPWAFRDIPTETDLDADEIKSIHQSLEWQPPRWYKQWWPEMRAFVLPTFSDAHVRINLAGRERDGIVPQDQYRLACDEIEAEIRACRNPRTGKSVAGDIVRIHDYDPMDPEGPDSDLVVFWSEAVDAFEHPTVGMIGPFPHQRTGEHSANGFAFISGPDVQQADLGLRSAFDITPTLLSLLGIEPDPDMAGSSLLGDTGVGAAPSARS